jgi:diadenosine tetraphosphatase ApaH/serine/threonine PP2A family protein phosphatase
MRYLVLADIHANLQALDAVLADAAARGYDQVLVLGDLVGYGANPIQAIDRTMALAPVAMIRGNHDKVCAGLESANDFNDAARASAEWTAAILPASHRDLLAALPAGPVLVTDALQICHGAPFDEDYYVFDLDDAAQALEAVTARLCLFGHTHVPAAYASADDPIQARDAAGTDLILPASPSLVNVGSVGQPRDGDPRAAYGLLDLDRDSLQLCRVAYDIGGAQARIRAAGLPEWLAVRLEQGH